MNGYPGCEIEFDSKFPLVNYYQAMQWASYERAMRDAQRLPTLVVPSQSAKPVTATPQVPVARDMTGSPAEAAPGNTRAEVAR